jgi:hypothetical protein
VAAINWGLVAGKTQTFLPWDSWDKPYRRRQPSIWFHEVFRTDGTPYKSEEAELIKQMTGKTKAKAALGKYQETPRSVGAVPLSQWPLATH